jgi:hypothetical protein
MTKSRGQKVATQLLHEIGKGGDTTKRGLIRRLDPGQGADIPGGRRVLSASDISIGLAYLRSKGWAFKDDHRERGAAGHNWLLSDDGYFELRKAVETSKPQGRP